MAWGDAPDFTPEERLFIKRCAERGVAINIVEHEFGMVYFDIDEGYVSRSRWGRPRPAHSPRSTRVGARSCGRARMR